MAPRRPNNSKKVLSRLQEEPENRKITLPPWLVFVLNLNLFPGLKWDDRDEGTFFAYSTHQRSKHWNPNQAAHSQAWSLIKNTCCDKKEIRNYKAGFRTALNSKGKPNKEQIKKIGKIKRNDEYWIKYRFTDRSFLSKEPNPFLQEYYSNHDSSGQDKFSSSNEGESSLKTSLPPICAAFGNYQRTDPERQTLGQQKPTTLQKDVQSSVSKRTKPVRNRKYGVKKPKDVVQKPRGRKNATSTTSQNSGNTLLSENCFSAEDEVVNCSLQYLNQMTPEPQSTDVRFKENGNTLYSENCFSPINEVVKSPLQFPNQMTPESQNTDVHLIENGNNLYSENYFSPINEVVKSPMQFPNQMTPESQNTDVHLIENGNTLYSENCFWPINEVVKSPLQFPNQMTPESQNTDVHLIENGNTPYSENCFSPINEVVKSPLQNQMTPEPQNTDVRLIENGGQNFHCFKNKEIYHNFTEYQPRTSMSGNGGQNFHYFKNREIYPTYTEHQPCTPMSGNVLGDTLEAFPPSSSYVPSNSQNSLNCIYNPQQNTFCHSMPNGGRYDTCLTNSLLPSEEEIRNNYIPLFCDPVRTTNQDLTVSLEHLPYYQNEESLAFNLIEKRYPDILSYEEFSILETDNY